MRSDAILSFLDADELGYGAGDGCAAGEAPTPPAWPERGPSPAWDGWAFPRHRPWATLAAGIGAGVAAPARHGPTLLMSGRDGDEECSRRPDPGGGRTGRRASTDPGFDRYLTLRLHECFDPILDEAVPDHLLRLVEGFAPRQGDAGDVPAAPPADRDDEASGEG